MIGGLSNEDHVAGALLAKNFLFGLLISFAGAFPPGLVDGLVLLQSATNGRRAALLFAAGCVLIEIIYVRASLPMMEWFIKRGTTTKLLRWLGPAAMILLAMYLLLSSPGRNDGTTSASLHPFVLGLSVMAINPLPLPFWMGWTVVLRAKNILTPGRSPYWIYVLGIGLGSFLAACVYVFAGQFVVKGLKGDYESIRTLVAVVLIVGACLQLLWKARVHKGRLTQEPE